VQLDGVNDYVQTPNLRTAFSNDTVTLELWFNAAAAGVIVDETGGPYNTNPGWHDSQIEILATGEVRIRVWSLASVSLGTVTFNTWHHAVLRYDQATQRLDGFLDGVASASFVTQNRDTPWESGHQCYYSLGSADGTNLGSGAWFNGRVDEFRVWNVARTQTQIQDNMYRPLLGNETGLVHYLRMDDGAGVTATDSSPNAWNGTLVNGAAFVVSTSPLNPTVNAVVGQDTVITLVGWDGDRDPLTASIATMPTTGALYQYNAGARGPQILAPGAVTDAGMRMIYVAPSAGTDSFTYTVSDGTNTSAAAPVNITNKSNQTITFNALPGKNEGDPTFGISATASSTLPITFSIVSGPATVASTGPTTADVTLTGSGANVVIRAAQAGDANYYPAPNVEQTFYVNARPVAGLAGTALRFDGVNDYVSLPSFTLGGALTFEAWVYCTDPSRYYSRVFDFANGAGNNNILIAFQDSSQRMTFVMFNGGAETGRITTPGQFPASTWVHVAATVDAAGQASLYWNGVLQVSGSIGVAPSVARGSNWIGRSLWGGDAYYVGQMDEFRIWSVVRTQAEIQSAMDSQMVGNEANLVTLLRFDDASGTTALDSGPGGHNGTLQNGTAWVGSGAGLDTIQMLISADRVITLSSFDFEGTALTTTVATVPPAGQGELYQYDSGTGGRGALIAAGNTVTDASKRVIYAAPASTLTTSFTYTASDGAATSAAASVNIAVKGGQTITFNPLPGKNEGDPTFGISATASSGLPITFSIVAGPATVASTGPTTADVTLTGSGADVVVRASQAGDATYLPAPNAEQTFHVNARPVAGVGGGALRFDGADDLVSVPNFGTYAPTTEITIEFWQRVSAVRPQETFALNPDTGNNRILSHVPWDNGWVYWDFGNIGAGGRLEYPQPGGGGILVNTWQHFALVASQSGNYMRAYRNGVLEGQKAGMEPFDLVAAALQIGGIVGWSFGGDMDEFRVWNVARSPADIQANMNTAVGGSTPNLFFCVRFDEAAGVTAVDTSPGGHDGTLMNGVARIASRAPIYTLQLDNIAVSTDTVFTLAAWDVESNPLTVNVQSIPAVGAGELYQYDSGTGGRGALIAAGNAVTDAAQRVIYAAPAVAGSASFTYTATDGVLTSNVATISMTIKGNQTITFNPLPGKNEGDPTFGISATASSGLPITFSIVSGPATVASTGPTTADITLTGSGADVVVRASQPGNGTYLPAPSVDQTFHINARPVAGLGGAALRFDGVDDFVQVASFGNYVPMTEITVEFWQYVTAAKNQSVFILEPDQNGWNRLNAHTPWSDTRVYWDFGDIGSNGRLYYVPPVSLTGTWQHFAFVASQSGNTMQIYRNGALEANQAAMDVFARYAAALQIGGNASMGFFGGSLDEFRIWSIARPQADIQATMNTPLTGAEGGLVLYQRFDAGAGTASADSSPSGYNGTLQNGVTWIGSTAPINTVRAPRSTDTVITLRAFDAEGGALTTTVATVPPVGEGELYQYDSATGGRGALITAGNAVTDAGKRVIYAAPATVGSTTSFTYTASDGVLTSLAATVNIIITKLPQTVTFAPVPEKLEGDPPFTVNATASSGLAVVISLVSGPATFDAGTNTVTITGAGIITLQATQAGDANYDSAWTVLTVPVRRTQTIDFPQPADIPFVGGTTPLSGTATSGLTVTFTVVSGPGTINGSSLTATGTGAIVVRASQAGDITWAAAPDVDRTVNVLGGTMTQFVYNGPADGDDYLGDWWYEPALPCLVTDAAGNVYTTGSSYGGPASDTDFLTIKYDNAGNKIWEARYSSAGALYDAADAIALDSVGNVYVAGYGKGWPYTLLLVKYDNNGVEQWVREYQGPSGGWCYPYSLLVDGAGNLYLPVQMQDSSGYSDIALLKYDSAGTQQWAAIINNTSRYDFPSAATFDSAGNVCVTGISYNPAAGWTREMVTTSFAPDGTNRWETRYTFNGQPYAGAYSIAPDASGNVYVTGNSYDGSTYAMTTVKYDTTGAEVWVARDDAPDGYATAIAADPAGNIVVSGYAYGPSNYEVRVIKYDPNGNVLWTAQNPARAGSDNYGEAMTLDGQGNIYVAGYTYTSATSSEAYVALKYNSEGAEQWVMRWNGTGQQNKWDEAYAITLDPSGNVFVGGSAYNGANYDYVILKCAQVPQTIDFPVIPDHLVGDNFQLIATARSGLPVTFTLVSGPATLNGDMLLVTGSGPITVRASQAGAGVYLAAPDVERTFFGKENQTISFGPLADKVVNDLPFDVTATATSGLPVTFSTVSGPAMIAGSTITLTGPGVVVVRASQAGNDLFFPAPDVDVSFTVFGAPSLISGPTATPNPAPERGPVEFTCVPSTSNVTVVWNFGDGTTATGATVTHAYTIPGTYSVTVTVTSTVNGSSSTETLEVRVYDLPSGVFDSDNDNFSDEIELALGSDPTSSASTPFSLAPPVDAVSPAITKLRIQLDFARPGNDSIRMLAWLGLAQGFTPSGQRIIIDVGGVVKSFVFDAKGGAKEGYDTVKLAARGRAGAKKCAVAFRKGTFAPALADEGLANASIAKAARPVLVTIIVGGQKFEVQVPQAYTAISGKGMTR
jgi:hypothetical protein